MNYFYFEFELFLFQTLIFFSKTLKLYSHLIIISYYIDYKKKNPFLLLSFLHTKSVFIYFH